MEKNPVCPAHQQKQQQQAKKNKQASQIKGEILHASKQEPAAQATKHAATGTARALVVFVFRFLQFKFSVPSG